MSKQTVLLITPSPTAAAAIEVATTDLNCRIERAHSVGDALSRLHNQHVHLVIVDQNQHVGMGIDLLAKMRELAPHTRRVLILDEEAEVETIVDALNRAEVSLIFKKPITDIPFIRRSLHKVLATPTGQPEHHSVVSEAEHARKLERLCTVGEIASDLIHQFSNILTIMNGHMELLLGELEDQKQKNRAQTILQAGQDGARLTRSIQDFVRLSKGNSEPVDLNELITETIQMTEPIWRSRSKTNGRGIEIHTRLQDIPTITASAGEIREVLTNLVINAVDAMPQGGNLTICTYMTPEGIHLEIEDTGIGMSESVRDRIFDPFFSTKGDKGNGLGLGIVKRIIRECDGTIDVYSEPGNGTCFTITLPNPTEKTDSIRPLFAST